MDPKKYYVCLIVYTCIVKVQLQMISINIVKSRFFKKRELYYWSNLPQNSNFGWELVQKSRAQIPVGEGQIFLSRFLFIFSIKNWILTHKICFFIYFYQLNINKNRYVDEILFQFRCNLLIYKKVVYVLIFKFSWTKLKKKNGKKFDPPPLGFELQIFEQNFPTQDLNFEGD